jgi:hypothetical protein
MYDERKEEETLQTFIQISFPHILSTDHELIPQGMRVLRQCTVLRQEAMVVTIQRKNIRPSKKEMNKSVTSLKCPMFAVRLCIFTADHYEVFRQLACSVLPPHCTKDVYTPQGSTRDSTHKYHY